MRLDTAAVHGFIASTASGASKAKSASHEIARIALSWLLESCIKQGVGGGDESGPDGKSSGSRNGSRGQYELLLGGMNGLPRRRDIMEDQWLMAVN
jgi:hypothetical protein